MEQFAKKTDKGKVMSMLRILSHSIDITPVGYGFVNHPLFESYFVKMPRNDSKKELLDNLILLDAKFLNDKAKVKSLIDEKLAFISKHSENVFGIFMWVSKPYRMLLLEYSISALTKKDFTLLLREIYVLTEFPNQTSIRRLIRLFKRADKGILFSNRREDVKYLGSLPETFTIYRGLQGKKAKIRGLSWTTSLDVAKWFSRRFANNNPVIYQAQIQKKNVFFYTNERKEDEVIINPFTIKNLQKVNING